MQTEHETKIPGPRPVSVPKKPLPAGAWDCHAHVFGPFEQFPLVPNAHYNPPLAPYAAYMDMLDTAGFEKGCVVHASANGYDNSTTADTVSRQPSRLRGIAVLPTTASDAELEALHASGVRGMRITHVGHRPPGQVGTLVLSEVEALAPRFRDLGWHFQVYCSPDRLKEYYPMLKSVGVPIIFDHMARCTVGDGVNSDEFKWILSALEDSNFYVKLTPGRVSKAYPEFDEVRPFHDAFIEAMPDRVVFGSDWPYIGNDATQPDVGLMVDLFDEWTPDETLRQKVFVENPDRFFGPF